MEKEPFSESEKRFVVTQILKASSIPLERLVLLLSDCHQEPHWDHIYLPPGRTLQECKDAFEALISSHFSSYQGNSNHTSSKYCYQKRKPETEAVSPQALVPNDHKRRYSGIRNLEKSSQQHILPKPLSKDISISTSNLPSTQLLAKKRGRPSKAENERRRIESMARSEIIVPTNSSFYSISQATSEGFSSTAGYTLIAPAPASTHSPGPYDSSYKVQNSLEVSSTRPQVGASLTTPFTRPVQCDSEKLPLHGLASPLTGRSRATRSPASGMNSRTGPLTSEIQKNDPVLSQAFPREIAKPS
ncbi:unnamed protein product [Blumeria hordei]|uniref:Uncharacterized protein n=1 Tax=Blumeria hordei TaxID=2867405 RepID=A0A383UZB5_BLUHO|nr:unnamed protein product [Blumeria hordei]